MDEVEAIDLMAEWGSYCHAGDPGACMYGFSYETGLKVQNEDHRTACLEWIDKCKCMVLRTEESDLYDPDAEFDKLGDLYAMIQHAESLEE
jgi:hypothetical protein